MVQAEPVFGWGLGIGLSFFVPDYEKVIKEGIAARVKEAQEELEKLRYTDNDSFDKGDYLRACIIALTAMQRMYHRYGEACTAKAEETADPVRKAELIRMQTPATIWQRTEPAISETRSRHSGSTG